MANLSLIRVNQKLAQAKVLLQEAEANNFSHVRLESCKEGAAFHLLCAYRHYLHEVAETYGVTVRSEDTEPALMQAFTGANKHPAEIQELMLLKANTGSWLAQLHVYYDSLWSKPAIETAADVDGLIKLVDLEVGLDVSVVTISFISAWHHAFVELVTRQRATSAEF